MSFNANDEIKPFKGQDYKSLKKQYSRDNLFKDPLFPADNTSLYSKLDVEHKLRLNSSVTWKRPLQIHSNAKFVVDGFNRHDLDQGALGDCWFIAACVGLMECKPIFERVVPRDQSFSEGYCGMFHFRFWFEGQWQDVVIDDRLPVNSSNRLIFLGNRDEQNEFWAALLEKAFAKLYGSYEAIIAGQECEALVDLAGAIPQVIKIDLSEREQYWNVLSFACDQKSIINASIRSDKEIVEKNMSNGLIQGHAYTVTAVNVLTARNGTVVRLLRVRNPWGNEAEWNGAWSDGSKEWNLFSENTKKSVGYEKKADGEFWMCYEDFIKNFHKLQISHVHADSIVSEKLRPGFFWKCRQYHGKWIKGKNTGNFNDSETKSQYLFQVKSAGRSDGKANVILALRNKSTRKTSVKDIPIAALLYRVKDAVNVDRPRENPKFKNHDLEPCYSIAMFRYGKDITEKYLIKPGFYVVIPCTQHADHEAEFFIRIFSLDSNQQ